MHQAVNERLYDLVYYLIGKGIDVNWQNKNGDTSLHLAIRMANKPIIKLLLRSRAEVDIVNNRNENPVEIASLEIRKFFGLESLLIDRIASKRKK